MNLRTIKKGEDAESIRVIIGSVRGDEIDPGPIEEECQRQMEQYIQSPKFNASGFSSCELIKSKVGFGEKECQNGFSPQGCSICELRCKKASKGREPNTMRFEGKITDSTNGCWIESGVCYVEIDNKWSIVVGYGLNNRVGITYPKGEVVGITNTKDDVDKKAEVYAKKVYETELTIYGSKEYFIRVINQ